MIAHSSMKIFDGDVPSDFEFEDLDQRKARQMFIAQNAWLGGFIFNISREQLVSAADNRRIILIWGWADYNDAFSGTSRYRTEFCYQLSVYGDPSVGSIEQHIEASQYWRHNAADDECYRRPAPYTPPTPGSHTTT
jgi:hypothetical protein